jgi:coenzyme F420-reducing hydrogenase delta subunit/formate hydrogenlyase subunit 6/NADH:ubiquinone oxidoreductase subunit I
MIQQKIEPDYNPRKLIRLAMLGKKERTFQNPTTWLCSSCDLCYSACPQEIHISGVIGAIKELAIAEGYSTPLETVSVDEEICSGCGICGMACPYGAPSLIEKSQNGSSLRRSSVDADKCMGCGTCVAACPMGAISRPGVSNQDIRDQLPLSDGKKVRPRMVVFICDWCLRADADIEILETYKKDIRVIHIPCSGRIDPEMALMALHSGIEGVLVCGCKPGECHFKTGTIVSSVKVHLLDRIFDQIGEKNGRIQFARIGTADRGMIRQTIDTMLEHLDTLK